MMPEATMTSRGRLTIPKEVREDLVLQPGSRIAFARLDTGHYDMQPVDLETESLREQRLEAIRDLAGSMDYPEGYLEKLREEWMD